MRRLVVLALSLGLLAGCGDDALWARFRAERQTWHAMKLVDRIRIQPRLAAPRDFERAHAAWLRIASDLPGAVWATSPRLDQPVARDVARLAGQALIAAGQIDDLRGRPAEALALFDRAATEYGGVLRVRLAAATARVVTLERAGDASGARSARAALARDFPPVDPSTGTALEVVLAAPLELAEALRESGHAGAADSTLDAATRGWEEVLARDPSSPAAALLWRAVAEARAAGAGGTDLALAALDRSLAAPGGSFRAAATHLRAAEIAFAGERDDRALAEVQLARSESDREIRRRALRLEGEIRERRGPMDSTLTYYLWLATRAGDPQLGLEARTRRGRLYEDLGQWEQARSEYRLVIAASASHPLAFAAWVRIVENHAGRGEMQLASFEARRALEKIDPIISTWHDDEVVLAARITKGRLRAAMGLDAEALDQLAEAWKRYPDRPEAARAALEAARLAERRIGDRARALQLYRELSDRAGDPALRDTARAAALRLDDTRNPP